MLKDKKTAKDAKKSNPPLSPFEKGGLCEKIPLIKGGRGIRKIEKI